MVSSLIDYEHFLFEALNHNTYPDLVLSGYDGTQINIIRFENQMNQDNGFLSEANRWSILASSELLGLEASDFDGDGIKDLVFVDNSNLAIHWIRNDVNGDGKGGDLDSVYQTAGSFSSTTVEDFAVGDVDGDSIDDYVLTDPGSDDLIMFYNRPLSDSTYGDLNREDEALGYRPGSVFLEDINGDDLNDLLVQNLDIPDQIEVYLNDLNSDGEGGDFDFAAPSVSISSGLGGSLEKISILDVNGDSFKDFAFITNNGGHYFEILINDINRDGQSMDFGSLSNLLLSFDYFTFTARDVDEDGLPEFLIVNQPMGHGLMIENERDSQNYGGIISRVSIHWLASEPVNAFFKDLNQDGFSELISFPKNAQSVSILYPRLKSSD
jgi:hypothetical protein